MRIVDRLRFALERHVIQGVRQQLLFIALLIGLVSTVAGLAALAVSSSFEHPGQAIWWAFLHLTDPGYLGDDEGTGLRIISTIVTVLGYVLFMGSLIAILTQWLATKMRILESGVTPIHQRGHILVLGWTNRTAQIVREMVVSEGRVERFLERIGARRLAIVILAEQVGAARVAELREELVPYWRPRQITLRSGVPLRIDHLRRVAALHAGVVIVPAGETGGSSPEVEDAETIKTLLSVSNFGGADGGRPLPLAVAEIYDTRKIPIARAAYRGELEIVASDTVIGRLVAQNVRHHGISHIFSELLSHDEDSSEIYVRSAAGCEGRPVKGIWSGVFPRAIVLGVLRPRGDRIVPHLNPPADFRIERGDRLVCIAHDYADTEPRSDVAVEAVGESSPPGPAPPGRDQRVLILGWNHEVGAILAEFESYVGESFSIDIVSTIPAATRTARLTERSAAPRTVAVRQIEGDYTNPAFLASLAPQGYDDIVLLASDRLRSGEQADARTLLGSLMLSEILGPDAVRPRILAEIMDPDDEALLAGHRGEVLVTPRIISHLLAHVALRRDLNLVFEELFTVGGAEIDFRPAERYGLAGDVGFLEVERRVLAGGDIAIGIRTAARVREPGGGVELNPPRDRRYALGPFDQVVVLTTYHAAGA